MKKSLCILLCLCICAIAPLTLASCQKSPEERDPSTYPHGITFMVDDEVFAFRGFDEMPNKVDMPTYPAKENEAFAGWYKDEACTTPFLPYLWKDGGQITVYARFEEAYLVPIRMEAEAFEAKILKPVQEGLLNEKDINAIDNFQKFKAYFNLKQYKSQADPAKKEAVGNAYPIARNKNIDMYVVYLTTSAAELEELESYIKKYCPDYTFEDLAEDHFFVEYLAQPIAG